MASEVGQLLVIVMAVMKITQITVHRSDRSRNQKRRSRRCRRFDTVAFARISTCTTFTQFPTSGLQRGLRPLRCTVAKAHSSFLGALCLAMLELQIESQEERVEEQILWRRYLASEFVDGTLYVVLGYAPGSDRAASAPACCVP